MTTFFPSIKVPQELKDIGAALTRPCMKLEGGSIVWLRGPLGHYRLHVTGLRTEDMWKDNAVDMKHPIWANLNLLDTLLHVGLVEPTKRQRVPLYRDEVERVLACPGVPAEWRSRIGAASGAGAGAGGGPGAAEDVVGTWSRLGDDLRLMSTWPRSEQSPRLRVPYDQTGLFIIVHSVSGWYMVMGLHGVGARQPGKARPMVVKCVSGVVGSTPPPVNTQINTRSDVIIMAACYGLAASMMAARAPSANAAALLGKLNVEETMVVDKLTGLLGEYKTALCAALVQYKSNLIASPFSALKSPGEKASPSALLSPVLSKGPEVSEIAEVALVPAAPPRPFDPTAPLPTILNKLVVKDLALLLDIVGGGMVAHGRLKGDLLQAVCEHIAWRGCVPTGPLGPRVGTGHVSKDDLEDDLKDDLKDDPKDVGDAEDASSTDGGVSSSSSSSCDDTDDDDDDSHKDARRNQLDDDPEWEASSDSEGSSIASICTKEYYRTGSPVKEAEAPAAVTRPKKRVRFADAGEGDDE